MYALIAISIKYNSIISMKIKIPVAVAIIIINK